MKNILTMLRQHAIRQPGSVALKNSNSFLTYAQLLEEVEFAATQLKSSQVQVLGIDLDNGFDWIIADLGAAMAEIPVVPLPWFFSQGQRLHALQDSGINFIISADASLAGLANVENILNFGLASQLVEISPPMECTRSFSSGAAKISYTSGSTGAPRGIALNAQFIDRTATAIQSLVENLGIENHLSLLPYSTLLENVAGVYVPILLGKTTIAESSEIIGLTSSLGIKQQNLQKIFHQSKADSVIVTPALLELLCSLVENNVLTPDNWRFVAVGGARVGETLLYRARNNGIPAYEGYGLTEFGSVACLNVPGQDRIGSVGKPLPGVQVSLSGENEICLDSELVVSPDSLSKTVFTGDYGRLDEEGYLYVHGRKCNQISLANGRNVAPEWIETELGTSRLIRQCFVYSQDQHYLSACLVCVAHASDNQIDTEVMRINSRLPAYARVRKWHRLQEPFSTDNRMLTANGRLRRSRIMNALPTMVSASNNHQPQSGR